MTTQLQSTLGRRVDPSRSDGRVRVFFYEARGHTEDNEALKQACGALIERGTFGGRLEVLGVADLHGLGFVRKMVAAAVKAMADRYGTELFMDFDGALRADRFGLRGGGAEVCVVGPEGDVCFCARGRLDETDVERFYAALGAVLEGRDRQAA